MGGTSEGIRGDGQASFYFTHRANPVMRPLRARTRPICMFRIDREEELFVFSSWKTHGTGYGPNPGSFIGFILSTPCFLCCLDPRDCNPSFFLSPPIHLFCAVPLPSLEAFHPTSRARARAFFSITHHSNPDLRSQGAGLGFF